MPPTRPRLRVWLRRLVLAVSPTVGLTTANAAQSSRPYSIRVDTGNTGERLLHDCSRESPPPGDGRWTPDSAAISQFLSRVAARLPGSTPDEADEHPQPLGAYVGEIAGFTRHSRRWIYAAFGDTAHARSRLGIWWCDGGWSFFGVEYDLEADTIGPIRPNDVGMVCSDDPVIYQLADTVRGVRPASPTSVVLPRRTAAAGTVVVRLLVSPDGSVRPDSSHVVRSAGNDLDQAVLDAAVLTRFRPATLHGCEVSFWYELKESR